MPQAADQSPPHQVDHASLPDTDQPMLVDVALPRHLYRVFTYRVPTHLITRVRIGSHVRVPFGHITLHGMVVGSRTAGKQAFSDPEIHAGRTPPRLREIGEVLDDPEDEAPPELLTLSRLVANHYLTPWGQCIRLILPVPTTSKTSHRYRLTDAGRELLANGKESKRLSPFGRDILDRLSRRPKGLTTATLRHGIGGLLAKQLAVLKRRGLIEETTGKAGGTIRGQTQSRRPAPTTDPSLMFPLGDQPNSRHTRRALETDWWRRVQTYIETARPARFLIQGPGLRRLSVAFQAIDTALKHARRALIVTPDIARAEALAATAAARWGDRVELYHSGLSPAARQESRHRIHSGVISIVVGTRSAIFAPMGSIGLIYVDDEESGALKEETEPRYHARDVAWMRAQLGSSVLLLGSAHPALETMAAFETDCDRAGALSVFEPGDSPDIHAIDLRTTPYGTVLSDPMITGIRAALEARNGVILFLNRKGFAPALACRECGNSPSCAQCSVALTFYKHAGRLACHYCGASRALPDTCPTCHAPRLQPSGIGTEAVEEWVRRLFPHARIARLDRETSPDSKQAANIRRRFQTGALDVLIGTQMLTQGTPALSAGFVGLVQADAGLHLPDFRATEQTYHTLMDAIALARPRETGGRVILQTLLPTHYVIHAVTEQNRALFYSQELAFRRALSYPPFTHLIGLRVSGRSPDRTRQAAEDWVERLQAEAPPQLTVWGPIPSAVSKLRERHRWQIAVKAPDAAVARQSVQKTLADLEPRNSRTGLKFEVDVDPITML